MHSIIATKELSLNIAGESPFATQKFDRMVLDFIAEGKDYGLKEYRDALNHYFMLRPLFDKLSEPYEAVLTLPAPGEAPKGLEWTGDSGMNSMWTVRPLNFAVMTC